MGRAVVSGTDRGRGGFSSMRPARFTRGEERLGESKAEIDGEPSEAAGVGEQNARFGFGDGLGKIAEMAVQFTGGEEAAEL